MEMLTIRGRILSTTHLQQNKKRHYNALRFSPGDSGRPKMVDWFNLQSNALWIFACAFTLATLSYASWNSSTQQVKLLTFLRGYRYQIALDLSGVRFLSWTGCYV